MRPRAPILFLALSIAAPMVPAEASGQPVGPGLVTWLSTGDSYSSGEGVLGNDGACAQSTDAYGPLAVRVLQRAGADVASRFTACSGFLIEDFYTARNRSASGGESLYEWGRSQGAPERVDVMALSFGGNDIGFAEIVSDCLALPNEWDLGLSGCDVSEEEIQRRIDALLDPPGGVCAGGRHASRRVDTDPDPYACDLRIGGGAGTGSILDFYEHLVRERLTDRGRLYVVGYPALFAPLNEWRSWNAVGCQGVHYSDAERLGRLAEALDVALQTAVSAVNARFDDDPIVFVPSRELYRRNQAELCGRGEDWLNGISVTRSPATVIVANPTVPGGPPGLTVLPPRFRYQGSFHPNAAGHAAIAEWIVGHYQDNRLPPAISGFDSSLPYWISRIDLAAHTMRVSPVLNYYDYTTWEFDDEVTVAIADDFVVGRVVTGATVDPSAFAEFVNSRDPDARSELAYLSPVEEGGNTVAEISPWTGQDSGEGIDWEYCISIDRAFDSSGEHLLHCIPEHPNAAERLRNANVPSLCEHPAGQLSEGELAVPAHPDRGDPGFVRMLDDYTAGDLDDDAALEYVTVVGCSQGGVAWPQHVLVYDDDFSLRQHVDTGAIWTDLSVWRSAVSGLVILKRSIVVYVSLESSAVEPTTSRSFRITEDRRCVVLEDPDTYDLYSVDGESGAPCD